MSTLGGGVLKVMGSLRSLISSVKPTLFHVGVSMSQALSLDQRLNFWFAPVFTSREILLNSP